MRSFLAAAGLLLVVNVLGFSANDPQYLPGVLVSEEPRQLTTKAQPFDYKEFKLTPLADYSISGRIIARNSYWFGKEARLAPIDVGLAWGKLSDQSVVDNMRFNISLRYLRWSASELSDTQEEIERYISNNHLIAANADVAKAISELSTGELVALEGKLVKAETSDGWTWNSSLSRTDTGVGSCELFYVEQVRMLSHKLKKA